jgi:hypothetical protein
MVFQKVTWQELSNLEVLQLFKSEKTLLAYKSTCSYVLIQRIQTSGSASIQWGMLEFKYLNANHRYGFVQNCDVMDVSCAQILNQLIKIVREVGFILR